MSVLLRAWQQQSVRNWDGYNWQPVSQVATQLSTTPYVPRDVFMEDPTDFTAGNSWTWGTSYPFEAHFIAPATGSVIVTCGVSASEGYRASNGCELWDQYDARLQDIFAWVTWDSHWCSSSRSLNFSGLVPGRMYKARMLHYSENNKHPVYHRSICVRMA